MDKGKNIAAVGTSAHPRLSAPVRGQMFTGVLVPKIWSNFHRGARIPGGVLYIFWVRGRAIGKGINFHDFGIRNGIDFHDFGIRNGINFRNFHNW